MEYRFKGTNTELDGHTIGNLFLTTQILMKGDFSLGIEVASQALDIQGRVIPISDEFNHIYATLKDGTEVATEPKIGHSNRPIDKVFYKKGIAKNIYKNYIGSWYYYFWYRFFIYISNS